MNWGRVGAIVQREAIDIRKNKMVLGAMAALPLIFVAMMLSTPLLMKLDKSEEDKVKGFKAPAQLAHLGQRDAFLVLLNDQYVFYLLMLPMILPTTIAAYSIVGENENRSLEPLLTAPVTTGEILAGKAAAAVLPAVAVTWASFAISVGGMYLITNPGVAAELIRPMWVVGILLLSPLLAMLSTMMTLCASSRFNDLRAVQGVSGMVVIPVIGAAVYILIKQLYLGMPFILWAILTMALANVGATLLAIKLFDRESILSRWK